MKNVLLNRIIIYTVMIWGLYNISQSDFYLTINPLWKTTETEHFKLRYPRRSPAADDIKSLATKMEINYDDWIRVFPVTLDKKIPYFFHKKKLYSGGKRIWGYTTRAGIHSSYSETMKDSSGHEVRHYIQDAVNRDAPYFFNEGACGYEIKIGGVSFHDRARGQCADIEKMALVDLVSRFTTGPRTEDYLAYSFTSFLLEQYPEQKFAQFYALANDENWVQKIAEIYEVPLTELEERWKQFLCNN